MPRRRVLQHWFDRVDGAMALLASMVRDRRAAGPAGSGARRSASCRPPPPRRRPSRCCAQPMDYYLQYVLDSTMTTLETVWKPAAHERCVVRGGQSGGPRLRPRAPSSPASWRRCSAAARLRGAADAARYRPALRRDALKASSRTRAGVSVGTALLAAVSRVAATPGAGAATADLMRLAGRLPAADLGAQRPAFGEPGRTGARTRCDRARFRAAARRRIGRRGLG